MSRDINSNHDQQLPPQVPPQPAISLPPPDERSPTATDSAVGTELTFQKTKPPNHIEGSTPSLSTPVGGQNGPCVAAPVAPENSAVPKAAPEPVVPTHDHTNQPENGAASDRTDANRPGGPQTSSSQAESQKSQRSSGRQAQPGIYGSRRRFHKGRSRRDANCVRLANCRAVRAPPRSRCALPCASGGLCA